MVRGEEEKKRRRGRGGEEKKRGMEEEREGREVSDKGGRRETKEGACFETHLNNTFLSFHLLLLSLLDRPNRLFMLSATSAGCTETRTFYHDKPGALYPQLTFFDQITAEGIPLFLPLFLPLPLPLFASPSLTPHLSSSLPL